MAKHPKQLILSSASPRRAELLKRMGLCFQIRPTNLLEDDSGLHGPIKMVEDNARLKASTLSIDVPDSLVLGSDTTVSIDDTILSKPKDITEAHQMLMMLSGRAHTVFTAVALYWESGSLNHVFTERSEVHFKTLKRHTIEHYFRLVNPLDKAGAYGIQKGRGLIIDRVEGSTENVMGLPIQQLENVLHKLEFNFRS